MPNETRHTLHIIGKPAMIDRWLRFSLMKPSELPGEWDDGYPRISFPHLCPVKTETQRRRDSELSSGVVYSHWRTRVQASIVFTCAWDYPKAFFERLPRYWKGLSLWCMVEDDMEQFGGMITIVRGKLSNLVRDYDARYNEDKHGADCGKIMDKWRRRLRQGQRYAVAAPKIHDGMSLQLNARFDPEESNLYFQEWSECAKYLSKARNKRVLEYKHGHWKPIKRSKGGAR